MAGSLRDQLIKSGLATSHQAKKAERQVRAEKQAQRQGGGQSDSAKAAAQQRIAEKAERDRALARAANEKAAAKALRAEIKQIVQQNDQRTKPHDDDVPYNFVHGKKIKRIYVTREHQAQLSIGALVIVNDDGRYHLVAKPVAERIRARDPKRIIAAHEDKPGPQPDDDHYAKFKVPDDLDW